MPARRLSVRKIKEVLRLKASGKSNRKIAVSCGIGRSIADRPATYPCIRSRYRLSVLSTAQRKIHSNCQCPGSPPHAAPHPAADPSPP